MWVIGLCVALLTVSARAQTEPYSESAPFLVNTSTPRIDTDGDGMPDNYENSVGLNPLFNDANADADGDGITNMEEYNAGSNPFAPDYPQAPPGVSPVFVFNARTIVMDTDGDGMSDAWEFAHGLDPFQNDSNLDPDGDGLANSEEYNAGTDPLSSDTATGSVATSLLFTASTAIYPFSITADTDGDGMPDWWEQRHGLNPLVSDAGADPDGDGLSNLAEYQEGRDPSVNESTTEVALVSTAFTLNTRVTRVDTDGDGIPDAWEIAHGLDPLRNDVNEDADGDGRSNLEEYNAGSDPQVAEGSGPASMVSPLFLAQTGGFNGPHTLDTDGDGIPDWWEIQYGLNPTVNDSASDSDGDGFTNLEEFNAGRNPIIQDYPAVVGMSGIFLVDTGGRSFDTDSDGLPDWWEKLYFNDARAANPLADTDGDGHSNFAEFNTGSNPLDANSVLKIVGLQATVQTNGTQILIRWASFEGSTYSIWRATVVQGPYSVVATNIAATPPLNTFTGAIASTNGLFRVGATR